MAVSIVVPYRPDGGHRDRAWSYVQAWWRRNFPAWQLVTGDAVCSSWCKAAAVADALTRAAGDIIVVADADVVCRVEDLRYLGQVMTSGAEGRWAVPHRRVIRLSEAGTREVYDGAALPNELAPRRRDGLIAQTHIGVIGGGMLILDRALYERVPLDPRFVEWGQEDSSWGTALRVMTGHPPIRLAGPLWHLWHQPQQRMSRAVGSVEGYELYYRYLQATTPEQMAALLTEPHIACGQNT